VLAALRERLLTPERIAQFRQELAAHLARHEKAQSFESADRARQLASLDKEIEHLVAAVTAGTFSPA